MTLKLGERLKQLRKSKDLTQEKLAECLGVSYQAVSRWERGEGYPDLSMIPLLAEFFNTTTDDLLGVNQEKKRHKIEKYLTCGAEYFNKQDFTNCTAVLRKALSEFPNSDELICALIKTLFYNHTNEVSVGNGKNNSDEIILLGKRILSFSLNDTLRTKTKVILINHYIHNLNDLDKAREIADSIPNFDYSQTFIPAILKSYGSEKQSFYQQMIMDHSHVVAGAIRSYIGSNYKLTTEEKIDLYQRCNKMYETLFDNEYDYDILLTNYFELAKLHMEQKEHDKAMSALMQCSKFAINWNKAKELSHTKTYRTPLLKQLPKHTKAIDAFEKNETRDIDLCAILLSEIECYNDIFKPLHDIENYNEVIKQITEFKSCSI